MLIARCISIVLNCSLMAFALTSCGPSAGDVDVVKITEAELPSKMLIGVKFKIANIENGVGPEETAERLKADGWTVEITKAQLRLTGSVMGRTGNTINQVAPISDFTKTLTAKIEGIMYLDGKRDTKGGSISVNYIGNNIISADYNINFSETYKQGPTWKSVADSLIKDMGMSSYQNLPRSLNGQETTYFHVPASGENIAGTVAIATKECHNPNSRATLTGERPPEDAFYDNTVCGISVSYNLGVGDGEKRLSDAGDKVFDILVKRYVEKFGEPECWEWDGRKGKCEFIKDSSDSFKIFDTLRLKFEKIANW